MTLRMIAIALLVAVSSGSALGQGLTVWTGFAGLDLRWLKDEAASFEAASGVPVEVVLTDDGEKEAMMMRSAPVGEGPDLLVGVPQDRIGALADGGVVADLSRYATASYLADLSEQARLAFTYAGKLYGLPMYVVGPALIVNADLVPELPATYEEMIALAQELTTADTWGYMLEADNFYFAHLYLRTFGGYVFGTDATGSLVASDVGLANDGAVRGARELRDLVYVYDLFPPNVTSEIANRQFIDGALGLIYTGPWMISAFQDAGIDLVVAPVPPLADGTRFGGFMGVHGVVLNEFGTQRSIAANFAKWLTRRDAQVNLAQLSRRIPASLTALSQLDDDPVVYGFGQALLNAEPIPSIPEMGRVWAPMQTALSVILGSPDSDLPATLERAVSEMLGD